MRAVGSALDCLAAFRLLGPGGVIVLVITTVFWLTIIFVAAHSTSIRIHDKNQTASRFMLDLVKSLSSKCTVLEAAANILDSLLGPRQSPRRSVGAKCSRSRADLLDAAADGMMRSLRGTSPAHSATQGAGRQR